MNHFINKNDKQLYFNQIKGVVSELNDGDKFCNMTLKVGHENTRLVNLSMRKEFFDEMCKVRKIGDKVTARFYLTSHNKNGRWYTTATVLEVFTEENHN